MKSKDLIQIVWVAGIAFALLVALGALSAPEAQADPAAGQAQFWSCSSSCGSMKICGVFGSKYDAQNKIMYSDPMGTDRKLCGCLKKGSAERKSCWKKISCSKTHQSCVP